MRGFSLVELSIVLVILGLLTGGILTGQSLIRAAELRSVTTEFQRYQSAVNTFRDKYFAMPGDMRNATQFWGRLNGNADCVTNFAAGILAGGSCDGNGNGRVESAAAASQVGEAFTFWQQLANAGLVEGSYTGIAGSGGWNAILGENAPRSKLSDGGWSVWYAANHGGNTEMFAHDFQNALFFGGQHSTNVSYSPILTTEEIWNIDTKMDDGKPGLGMLMSMHNNCTDATSETDFDADYMLAVSGKICRIVFPQVF